MDEVMAFWDREDAKKKAVSAKNEGWHGPCKRRGAEK